MNNYRREQPTISLSCRLACGIFSAMCLLTTTEALAVKSGFPSTIAILGQDWDWYKDDNHVSSPDGSQSAFRRCSGDRDKWTCLTFIRQAGEKREPILACNPASNSNQVPIGFSNRGLLIWEVSRATLYGLGEGNRCKALKNDVWSPGLAPDGLRFAYLTSFVSGGANVFIHHLGTGRTTQLTHFRTKKMPGGQESHWIREGEKVGLMDPDRQLWLPDRTEGIVFEVQDDDGFGATPMETWLVRPDGSGLRKIAEGQFSIVRPKTFGNPHESYKPVGGCLYGSPDCRSKGSAHTGTDSWGDQKIVAAAPGKVVKIQLNDQRDACQTKGTAICAGQVKAAGACSDHGLGNTVILEHKLADGKTIYSLYAHLTVIDPNVEERLKDGGCIKKGESIGTMGSTGYGQTVCWGKPSHLHFEIKTASELGDPKSKTYFGYVTDRTITNPDALGYRNPGKYIGKVEALCY